MPMVSKKKTANRALESFKNILQFRDFVTGNTTGKPHKFRELNKRIKNIFYLSKVLLLLSLNFIGDFKPF